MENRGDNHREKSEFFPHDDNVSHENPDGFGLNYFGAVPNALFLINKCSFQHARSAFLYITGSFSSLCIEFFL